MIWGKEENTWIAENEKRTAYLEVGEENSGRSWNSLEDNNGMFCGMDAKYAYVFTSCKEERYSKINKGLTD